MGGRAVVGDPVQPDAKGAGRPRGRAATGTEAEVLVPPDAKGAGRPRGRAATGTEAEVLVPPDAKGSGENGRKSGTQRGRAAIGRIGLKGGAGGLATFALPTSKVGRRT